MQKYLGRVMQGLHTQFWLRGTPGIWPVH